MRDNHQNQSHEHHPKSTDEYHGELWSRFLSACERAFTEPKYPIGEEVRQSLDLIGAINSYRTYPNMEDLMVAYPELEEQIEYVKLLWKHFDTMSQEDLSLLAMDMVHEISNCSPTMS